jgi:hypothetical protein
MQRFLAKFLRDDSGATAIEYGLQPASRLPSLPSLQSSTVLA